jgi:branched-chain amino acid transport system substrate-binding protein
VQIGVEASVTGGGGEIGTPQVDAMELATSQINSSGGVTIGNRKYKLQLIVKDDQSVPATGVQVVTQLLQQHVHILMGATSGEVFQAYEPLIANKSGVVFLVNTTNLPGITKYLNVYRYQGTVQQGTAADLNFYAKQKYKRVAILTDRTNAGFMLMHGPEISALEKMGTKVVYWGEYSEGDTQYGAQLSAIIAAKPDALEMQGFAADMVRIMVQARALGYKGAFVAEPPIAETDVEAQKATASVSDLWNINPPPPTTIAALSPDSFYTSAIIADAKAMVSAFKAKYGFLPGGTTSNSYTSMYIMAAALSKISSPTDTSALESALNSLKPSDLKKSILPSFGPTVFVDRQANLPVVVQHWTTAGPTGEYSLSSNYPGINP